MTDGSADDPGGGLPPPPVAPRTVRWRPCLRWRWPLGLISGAGTAVVVPIVLALWWASGFTTPFPDQALDSRAQTTEARVMEARPTSFHLGRTIYQVHYTFERGSGRQFGTSYSLGNPFRQGRAYTLEYLPDDPSIHRLRGTRASLTSWWWDLALWLVAPPLLLLLWWLRGMLRLRLLLRDGPAARAAIEQVGHHMLIHPPQLQVRYRFTDRHGLEQTGGHMVGRRSPLGAALEEGTARAWVVYDDVTPGYNRLVGPGDFD